MSIDRKLQNAILVEAEKHYPMPFYLDPEHKFMNLDEKEYAANLKYLEENHLIRPNSFSYSIDGIFNFNGVQITNRGLDFLADDGGLSAILDVVTVKFETETLAALIADKISETDQLDQQQKDHLVEAVKELPAEGMKHLLTKVIDKGVENIPTLVNIITNTVNSL